MKKTCTGCMHLDEEFNFCDYYSAALWFSEGVFYRSKKCLNIPNYRKKCTPSETNKEYITFNLSGGKITKKGRA